MKRWTAVFLILSILTSAAWASASIPSVSTNDTTEITTIRTSTGVEVDAGFREFLVESPPAIKQQIGKFFTFTNNPEDPEAPVYFFSQNDQQEIQDALPENMDLDTLQVNEIVSLKIVNYDVKYGDVNIEFEFATQYEEGKIVTILLGLTHADPSVEWDEAVSWDDNTDWLTLEAIALDNGDLRILFPQNVLLDMEQALAITMVIFNE